MNFLKKIYLYLVNFGIFLQPFFLLVTRLFWGILFYFSGMGKLENLEQTASFFQNLGIPFSEFSAHFVAWLETIGGLCLVIGFASRLVSIPLAICMIVALLTAHFESIQNVWSDPSTLLSQVPFSFLFALLVIFVFGPGKLSLDYAIEKLVGARIEK